MPVVMPWMNADSVLSAISSRQRSRVPPKQSKTSEHETDLGRLSGLLGPSPHESKKRIPGFPNYPMLLLRLKRPGADLGVLDSSAD